MILEMKNDTITFSHAMNCKESNLWFNAMKDEMNSMASNGVWDLVKLPNEAKTTGCKWVYKTKTHWATLRDIKQDLSRPYPRLGEERGRGMGLGLLHLHFRHWWAHCNKQIHKEIKILIPPS